MTTSITQSIVEAIAGVVILAAIGGAALLALAATLWVWPKLLGRSEERLPTRLHKARSLPPTDGLAALGNPAAQPDDDGQLESESDEWVRRSSPPGVAPQFIEED